MRVGMSQLVRSPVAVGRPARVARPARAQPALRPKAVAEEPRQEAELSASAPLAVATLLAPFLLDAGLAQAAGGEFGVLEGRSFALVHPAIMFFLLGATGYTGYLGLKIMRARNLAEEIKARKADLKVAVDAEGKPLPSPASAEITALEQERKQLISEKNLDKHNNWGSLLLGLGVTFSIAGGYNTFLRTGKLFPGPHLYAGALITVLWALAAAMVPPMQKGNELARSLHITFNVCNLLLFISQVPTGLEIVGKVFQFTTWP